MIKTIAQMIRLVILTEKIEPLSASAEDSRELQQKIRKILRRALCIRHVDASSCN